MKREQAFPSNYLAQSDVPHPILATIAGVHVELLHDKETGGKKQKPVMTFSNDAIRPLIVNNHNWSVIESAYGDDSDAWIGKPVEIFVDPNITFGKRRTGGLRVRIPLAQTPPSSPANPSPAPRTPAQPTQRNQAPASNGTSSKPAPLTDLQAHERILDAYRRATTMERLDQWRDWGRDNYDFTPLQADDQSDAYHKAVERITGQRPETAGTGARRDDIPF